MLLIEEQNKTVCMKSIRRQCSILFGHYPVGRHKEIVFLFLTPGQNYWLPLKFLLSMDLFNLHQWAMYMCLFHTHSIILWVIFLLISSHWVANFLLGIFATNLLRRNNVISSFRFFFCSSIRNNLTHTRQNSYTLLKIHLIHIH